MRTKSLRAWLTGLLAATIGAGLMSGPGIAAAGPAPSALTFFHEFYGSRGYRDPHARLNFQQGMMNGLTLWPPAEADAAGVLDGSGGLMLRLPGAAGPAGQSLEEIDKQVTAFARLSPLLPGAPMYWNLLPEWDQSGGAWVPNGRPRYAGRSRPDAHQRFLEHYSVTHPKLTDYLRGPSASGQAYRLAAITDHSANVFFGYELGAELQMLERGIDELGDLSTGIAYVRGAAQQYSRPWGIDISTWRTTNKGATRYDASGRLLSGWSASYIERIYYLAFAAGAQVIHNEATAYRYQNGELNPFGEVTRQFADFALRRHPDVGQPSVNVAILTDHFSGFDPKHGVHNQASAVWYQDLPYSNGDYMTDNFFRLAYPGHWLHGLAPGAPFANERDEPLPTPFTDYLAKGGDPRPYEPMPITRWGDNLDVLTNRVEPGRLSKYRAIVMVGEVALDSKLREGLAAWVNQGGLLVVNAAQATPADEELLGAQITSRSSKTGTGSRWITDSQFQSEQPFAYLPVRPFEADVLAVSDSGEPLITRRAAGEGEVILTTPLYLQPLSRRSVLKIGVQLLDGVFARLEPARAAGPPIEYVIGRPSGKVVFTLANHFGTPWQGALTLPEPDCPFRAVDYRSDQEQSYTIDDDGSVAVPVTVPPYGVRVIAIEHI